MKSFSGNFYSHLATFCWSHWLLRFLVLFILIIDTVCCSQKMPLGNEGSSTFMIPMLIVTQDPKACHPWPVANHIDLWIVFGPDNKVDVLKIIFAANCDWKGSRKSGQKLDYIFVAFSKDFILVSFTHYINIFWHKLS